MGGRQGVPGAVAASNGRAVAPGRRTGVLDGTCGASAAQPGTRARPPGPAAAFGGAPGVAGRPEDDDADHTDRYYRHSDELFGADDRLDGVAPAVLGEDPEWRP